jgi:hypothetical protein
LHFYSSRKEPLSTFFSTAGTPSLQLRGLVLEASVGQMLLPAGHVPGLGEDVQVGAQAARNDRHVSPLVKGQHLKEIKDFSSSLKNLQ